ncbi:MAG: helix-turn-helix transcriptional regulator [Bacillus sp. (in: firmicutes)]
MDDHIYYNILGRKIRQARQVKNLTIEKLAEHVEMSTNHIRDIEVGNKRPLVGTFHKLCEALHLNAQKVFDQVKKEREEMINSTSKDG